MRLLQKSDIVKAKADAQRQTVDEGAKLARRIDRLREVSAQEEKSLDEWRKKTLEKFHGEIAEIARQLDEAKDALRLAIRDREEAMKPLTEEAEAIAESKSRLHELEAKLYQREVALSIAESEIEEVRKDIKDALIRAETREFEAQKAITRSFDARRDAEKALEEATKIQNEAENAKKSQEYEFALKTKELTERESVIQQRELQIEKDRVIIEEEKRRLDDRASTLERAFKRLNK